MIPYLEFADARFGLKLPMSKADDSVHEKTRFPFVVIREADPLASILEASILSDAGSRIKSVFLLIQKDDYHLTKDGIWPTNNRDVHRAWQSLFSFLTTSYQDDSIVILKDQVDVNGKLLPWQSLFYCAHRQVFFEPSCPKCGLPLQICCDEDLLLGVGLQSYSTSLKRYLFCPNCIGTLGESDFYVYSLDDADPAILKDQRHLVKGFGQLARDETHNASIPCIGCADFEQCYETKELSFSRVVPLSFYPFFMMVLDAPSVHVLDFLPLLAGADINDLAAQLETKGQQGRLKLLRNFEQRNSQKPFFLFDKHERFFLEVLYLKLSLLGELAQIVFSGLDKFKYPDLSLSMDKIWVTAAEQSGMLPVLWNFKLNLMGIGGDSAQALFPRKSPPSYGLHFLGSTWFCGLLANSRQDFSRIHSEIAKVVEDLPPKDDSGPELASKIQHSAISSPENILWKPDQETVNASWATLWTRSLDLGLLLLNSSMSEISQWSQTTFWQEYEQLKTDIRKALFMPKTEAISTSPAHDNKAIHEILSNIAKKWQSTTQSVPSGAEGISADLRIKEQKILQVEADLPEDIVVKETVILSADDFREKLPPSEVEEDHVPEAIVAKPGTSQPPETPTAAPELDEDIPETVIFAHGTPKGETSSPAESAESDIPETVIISSKEPSAPRISSEQKRPAEADNSKLTKQGISKVPGETPVEEKPARGKEKDDDIPETVIFDPTKKRNEQKDND
ncbi:MAG: hypothetical protein ACETVU_05850 [Desulfatiglandales bacterium]